MRLDEPLLRLPLRFDAGALAAEIATLPPEAWVAHPDKLPGNEAVRLVTPGGAAVEGVSGTMAPTPYLLRLPYVMTAMAAIGAVWGRGRLMRLSAGAVVPPHVDTNFYWRKHVRIHVPIVTTPDVLFSCGHQTVHMAAGECWIFDTFSSHHVRNGGSDARVHLVIDTVGGEWLWDLIEQARLLGPTADPASYPLLAAGDAPTRELAFERDDGTTVMSPWELRYHVAFLAEQARPHPRLATIMKRMERFVAGWSGIWASYGASSEGAPAYRALIAALERELPGLGGQSLMLRNQLPLYRQVTELLFTAKASLPAAVPLPATAQRRAS
ncbi:aspartyl/asparaginyl beta-hydroxylase domain-containing protein [Sphingomonas sp. GB1N7]|uniref:aspartyl/asparaginyl beta-hydroxylase domain-containing protein n=1 Tax=Parasphingomonas caseinilytica TaxID=3096158 RepID=UPI002FC6820E